MSQKKPLLEAELRQHSKELELDIAVMTETATIKSNQVEDYQQQLKRLQEQCQQLVTEISANKELQAVTASKWEARIAKLKNKEADYQTRCAIQLESLRDIKQSINERSDYLKSQKDQISEAINEGSIRLTSLKYEIDDLVLTKKLLKTEINEFLLTKQKAYVDTTAVVQELDELTDRYKLKSEEYEAKILQAQKDHQLLLNKAATVDEEVTAKLKVLQVRELEILVKRDALKRESDELQLQRRRNSGVESLYDV